MTFVLGLQCAQSSDHCCKIWYSESDSEWFEYMYQYITTGRLYHGFKLSTRETTMSWHSLQETDINHNNKTQQWIPAMVMLLSGSWQPDRQYNNGAKHTQLCCGTFAEPVRKIHVSNVRNQKNWKYMITASQNIKNYSKTPLEHEVMSLRQNHLFFMWIRDFRVDLRSDNGMYIY